MQAWRKLRRNSERVSVVERCPETKPRSGGFAGRRIEQPGDRGGSSAANALAGSPTPAALAPESLAAAARRAASWSRRATACQIVGGSERLHYTFLENLQGISKEIQDGLEFGFKRVIASTPMRPATCFRHLGGQVDGGSLCAKLRRQFNPDPQKRGGPSGGASSGQVLAKTKPSGRSCVS